MPSPFTYLINPYFKGLVHYPSQTAITVIYGTVVGNGEGRRRATNDEYLAAVRTCARECPQLAQTLARTVAAAILAIYLARAGQQVWLLSVEGCRHHIGGFVMLGYEVVGSIWEFVVRPCHPLPSKVLGGTSCCTVEESRLILGEAHHHEGLVKIWCVTHGYHQQRVDWTLQAAMARTGLMMDRVTLLPTTTPCLVMTDDPCTAFLREIILAASVHEGWLKREERAERLNRWFYRCSSFLEWITGGRIDPETWLASKRRHRLKTA